MTAAKALSSTYRVLRDLGARAAGTEAALRGAHDLFVLQRFPEADAEAIEREARCLAKNWHPNIARVRHVETLDGELVIATDFLDGLTLGDLLALARAKRAVDQPPLAAPVVGRILLDVLSGLQNVHGMRDDALPLAAAHGAVCPTNVVVGKDGVARLVASFRPRAARVDSNAENVGYAAPEVLEGQLPDARSDLFACGVMLWELFQGRELYPGTNLDVLHAQRESEIPWTSYPAAAAILTRVKPVVLKALAFDPALRFKSANELATALRVALGKDIATGSVVAQLVVELGAERIRARRVELDPRGPAKDSGKMPAVKIPVTVESPAAEPFARSPSARDIPAVAPKATTETRATEAAAPATEPAPTKQAPPPPVTKQAPPPPVTKQAPPPVTKQAPATKPSPVATKEVPATPRAPSPSPAEVAVKTEPMAVKAPASSAKMRAATPAGPPVKTAPMAMPPPVKTAPMAMPPPVKTAPMAMPKPPPPPINREAVLKAIAQPGAKTAAVEAKAVDDKPAIVTAPIVVPPPAKTTPIAHPPPPPAARTLESPAAARRSAPTLESPAMSPMPSADAPVSESPISLRPDPDDDGDAVTEAVPPVATAPLMVPTPAVAVPVISLPKVAPTLASPAAPAKAASPATPPTAPAPPAAAASAAQPPVATHSPVATPFPVEVPLGTPSRRPPPEAPSEPPPFLRRGIPFRTAMAIIIAAVFGTLFVIVLLIRSRRVDELEVATQPPPPSTVVVAPPPATTAAQASAIASATEPPPPTVAPAPPPAPLAAPSPPPVAPTAVGPSPSPPSVVRPSPAVAPPARVTPPSPAPAGKRRPYQPLGI